MIALPIRNAGNAKIVDHENRFVAQCATTKIAEVLVEAINKHFRRKTRIADPETSHKAERSMTDMMKNRHRRTALELFLTKGPMCDEMLWQQFQLLEVHISQSRIQHIRLELFDLGLIIERPDLVAKTTYGQESMVYSVKEASGASHD